MSTKIDREWLRSVSEMVWSAKDLAGDLLKRLGERERAAYADDDPQRDELRSLLAAVEEIYDAIDAADDEIYETLEQESPTVYVGVNAGSTASAAEAKA